MPTSSEPSRGRSSSRRLPPDLVAANQRIQARFQQLRASLYIPQADRMGRTELRHRQQALLGEALGLEAPEIARLEDSKEGIPAAVLFRLMHRYDLPSTYFTNEEVPLSSTFLVEQKRRELEDMIQELRDRAARASHAGGGSPRRTGEARPGARKGGWLKGLPRNPKTPGQFAIRRLWEIAREREFIPSSLEDLTRWGKEQGLKEAEALPATPLAGTGASRPRAARETRPGAAVRKGGWLKGLPRNPKTPEQFEIRRMWDEARRQGLHFSSLRDLKAWWEAPPVEEAPAGVVEEASPGVLPEVVEEAPLGVLPEVVEEAPPVVLPEVVEEAPPARPAVTRKAPAPKARTQAPARKAAPKKASPAGRRPARTTAEAPAAPAPEPEAPAAPGPEAPARKTAAARTRKRAPKAPARKKPASPKGRSNPTRGGATPPETVN